MSQKKISVVILNWNNAGDTIDCIKSVLQSKNVDFNIVICDNASTDDSFSTIKSYLLSDEISFCDKKITLIDDFNSYNLLDVVDNSINLIQTGQNLGYAGGNNVGIKFSISLLNADYIWVLNNDTVVSPDALYNSLIYCENKKIDVLGSKICYFSDRNVIQSLGGYYNKWTMTTSNAYQNSTSDLVIDCDEISKLDYLIGASLFVNKKVFDAVGLLCEDYFLYYEEIDFFNRIKNKFKFSICFDSLVYHKVGASTKSGKSDIADFCSVRNRLYIAYKFHPQSLFFTWISLFGVFINRLMRGEFKKAKNVFLIIFGKRVF